MDIAVISPTKDLDLSDSLSHLYMVLSWLCKEDPQYKSHFTNIKRTYDDAYVILDNGANENNLSTDEEIINIAYDIFADEIVAPDVFRKGEETIKRTSKFLDKYYDKRIKDKLNVMAVLQGTEYDTLMKSYNTFLNDPRIGVLGVGYRNLSDPMMFKMKDMTNNDWIEFGVMNVEHLKRELTEETFYFTVSRAFFLHRFVDFKELKKHNKKIHLLGIMNPYELALFNHMFAYMYKERIRGCDSAAPCQAAQAGVSFDRTFGVKEKPKALLDFTKRLTAMQRRAVEDNIKIMKGWI